MAGPISPLCSSESACAATRKSWFSRSVRFSIGSARPSLRCWRAVVRCSRRPAMSAATPWVSSADQRSRRKEYTSPGASEGSEPSSASASSHWPSQYRSTAAVAHVARSARPVRWANSRDCRRASSARGHSSRFCRVKVRESRATERRSAWPASSPRDTERLVDVIQRGGMVTSDGMGQPQVDQGLRRREWVGGPLRRGQGLAGDRDGGADAAGLPFEQRQQGQQPSLPHRRHPAAARACRMKLIASLLRPALT